MLAEVLKLVHVVAGIVLLVNFALLAAWKVSADRAGDAKTRAFVLDRVHALDRRVTAWAGLATFAAGYPIIRVLGLWGGSISAAPWAFAALVMMTFGGLAWYFGMLPLEVKMADAADRAAEGGPLDDAYARWSGAWLALAAVSALDVLVIAALMVFKPGT